MQEDLPDLILFEGPVILLLEHEGEISALAVLHDDVEAVLIDEAFQVAHDERVVEAREDGRLVDGLRCCTGIRSFAFSLSCC